MAQTKTYTYSKTIWKPNSGIGISSHMVKGEFIGVYDSKTNTSDWTFNVYISQVDLPTYNANTTGVWSYSVSCYFYEYAVGDGTIGSKEYHYFAGKSSSITLNDTDWHLIGTHTLTDIPHSRSRQLGIDSFYVRATPPKNTDYDLGSQVYKPDLHPKETWACRKYEASTVTATHANIGQSTTISLTNQYDTGLTHTVYYSLDGGTTKNIIGSAYRTDRKFTWQVPDIYYEQIPSAKRGTIYIYVDTFEEDKTQVGSRQYTTFWAYTVEDNCRPTLSPVVYDSNSATVALTGDNSKLIKYKSNASYAINASARKYATIKGVEIRNDSVGYTTTTGTFENIMSNSFVFYATDSRGYVTSSALVPTMINYIPLTCVVDADAPTADGIMSFIISGDYFSGSFGAQNNTLELKYRIKEGSGSFGEWVAVTPDISDKTYTCTVTLTGMDYMSNYTVEAYAKDVFGQTNSNSQSVATIPIFDWSVNDFAMNVPMTVFGQLTVNGDITCTGTINGESSSGEHEGGMCYGICETGSTTNAKLVTCGTFSNLVTGASIRVKFAYGNIQSSPTMNVNGTGAISIKRYGTTSDVSYMWCDGAVIDFVYDGQYWLMIDGLIADTNYYGKTKLSTTISPSDQLSLTPSAVYNLGIESGSWTPTLGQSAAVSSYNVRQGWYQKIGNCVTIGFHVSVTTNSGYNDTNISITGLPYTPAYAAFGGGIAYNIYTPANQIFEGWMIDTSGVISIRTQTETKTTASNLSIGSSAGYTNGSATMTLAGTICYTIS